MNKGWLTALPLLFSGMAHGDEPAKPPPDFDVEFTSQVARHAAATLPKATTIPLHEVKEGPQFRLAGPLIVESGFRERLVETLFTTDRVQYNEEFDGLTYDIASLPAQWKLQFLAASDGNGDADKINQNFPVMPQIKSLNGKKVDEDDPAIFLRLSVSF